MKREIIAIERDKLYRQENYSDLIVGKISCNIPITIDGVPDPTRPLLFAGQTMVRDGNGQPVPFNFPIEGATLAEAVDNWSQAIDDALTSLEEAQTSKNIRKSILQALPLNGKVRQ